MIVVNWSIGWFLPQREYPPLATFIAFGINVSSFSLTAVFIAFAMRELAEASLGSCPQCLSYLNPVFVIPPFSLQSK